MRSIISFKRLYSEFNRIQKSLYLILITNYLCILNFL